MVKENKPANKDNKTKMKALVRIMNKDVKGEVALAFALRKVKGVNYSIANLICNKLEMDASKKVGYLSDDELKKIKSTIQNLSEIAPEYMLNRRKDYETGENKHLFSADLILQQENDIKKLMKIKSRRGLRHAWGLPVRGQKTKAHFRHKSGAIGVQRKKRK